MGQPGVTGNRQFEVTVTAVVDGGDRAAVQAFGSSAIQTHAGKSDPGAGYASAEPGRKREPTNRLKTGCANDRYRTVTCTK